MDKTPEFWRGAIWGEGLERAARGFAKAMGVSLGEARDSVLRLQNAVEQSGIMRQDVSGIASTRPVWRAITNGGNPFGETYGEDEPDEELPARASKPDDWRDVVRAMEWGKMPERKTAPIVVEPVPVKDRPYAAWAFPSSSGVTVYETTLFADGALVCNCPGFIFKKKDEPRSCKHTKLLNPRVVDLLDGRRQPEEIYDGVKLLDGAPTDARPAPRKTPQNAANAPQKEAAQTTETGRVKRRIILEE